jgi:3-hydroxybutyryl-CoA dehydratase
MALLSLDPDSRVYFVDELKIGMTAAVIRRIGEADVVKFAEVTGDHNPVHFDEAYAQVSKLGGRVVHGILSAGLISAAIGTSLPGPGTIYLKQTLKFCAPVRIDDVVEARVTVAELRAEKNQVLLATCCRVGRVLVLDGEALVLPPRRPSAAGRVRLATRLLAGPTARRE